MGLKARAAALVKSEVVLFSVMIAVMGLASVAYLLEIVQKLPGAAASSPVWLCLGILAAVAFAAGLIATWAIIEVKAMQRSTHRIEYVNPWTEHLRRNGNGHTAEDPPFQPLSDKQKQALDPMNEYDSLS